MFLIRQLLVVCIIGPAKEPWKAGEEKINKFVFIGKGLDRKELTKGLMECLYKDEKA